MSGSHTWQFVTEDHSTCPGRGHGAAQGCDQHDGELSLPSFHPAFLSSRSFIHPDLHDDDRNTVLCHLCDF